MKLCTPGNPKMYLWSVLLSIRITVKCLYYEICGSAIHDSLVQPHTCSLASTLLRLKTSTIEKWAAKVGMFALSRPFLSMPLTWRTKIPQYVKRWPQGCDSKSLSVVLIIRLWANMVENIADQFTVLLSFVNCPSLTEFHRILCEWQRIFWISQNALQFVFIIWLKQSLKCTYNVTLRLVRVLCPGCLFDDLTIRSMYVPIFAVLICKYYRVSSVFIRICYVYLLNTFCIPSPLFCIGPVPLSHVIPNCRHNCILRTFKFHNPEYKKKN